MVQAKVANGLHDRFAVDFVVALNLPDQIDLRERASTFGRWDLSDGAAIAL